MEAKLVIVSGAAKAGEFPLKLPTVIGRSRTVDLPLAHALVSRQHCKLYEVDGVLKLKDLGSLNGTFVGEERVTEETVLLPGAQFTVGPVTFRAVYGDVSVVDDPGDLSEISEIVTPPRASDDSSSSGPAPAATLESGAKPTPSAASELKTEALKPLNETESPADSFAPPESSATFDGGAFDWLEQPAAAAAGESDTAESLDFVLADIPSNTPSVGNDQTVQSEPPGEESSAPAPSKRDAKKQPAKSPMKGLFSRGNKSEKAKQPAAEKTPAEKPAAKPAKSAAPAAAKKPAKSGEAPKPTEQSATASPAAADQAKASEEVVDEFDFTLPEANHEGTSDLKNTLDFL